MPDDMVPKKHLQYTKEGERDLLELLTRLLEEIKYNFLKYDPETKYQYVLEKSKTKKV
jgi:hypothetical protein